MRKNDYCDKAALIEVWRQIRHQAGPGSLYAPVDLKEAILLVNQTFALFKNRILTWDELISEADIDESDAVFIVRRALFLIDEPLDKSRFVVVSVNEQGEHGVECFLAEKEKAEEIAKLLRTCPLFYIIRVMTAEEFLNVVDFPEAYGQFFEGESHGRIC